MGQGFKSSFADQKLISIINFINYIKFINQLLLSAQSKIIISLQPIFFAISANLFPTTNILHLNNNLTLSMIEMILSNQYNISPLVTTSVFIFELNQFFTPEKISIILKILL